MRKQILILANSSDGLYGFRKELLSELCRKSTVHVVVPNNGYITDLEEIGCNVFILPLDRRGINPIADIKLIYQYYTIINRIRPDQVITYTIKPNIYGGIICRLLQIPYSVNITGLGTAFQLPGVLKNIVTILYTLALKKARNVFFENIGNMQTMLGLYTVREEQCHILNGAGVNLDFYKPVSYPNNSYPVRFLFIGRIMKEKGVDELFYVMNRLIEEGIDCQLDLLGYYEDNYKEIIQKYVELGWLHYHGYVKDVRPYINQAHCFVLPSWHEGMANTNLECAAMGRPIITSRIHGCMEAVIEGKSGLLCEPQNVDSLYEQMLHFCRTPNSQREAMGKVGRRHMEVVFDKVRVVTETITALNIR